MINGAGCAHLRGQLQNGLAIHRGYQPVTVFPVSISTKKTVIHIHHTRYSLPFLLEVTILASFLGSRFTAPFPLNQHIHANKYNYCSSFYNEEKCNTYNHVGTARP